MSFHSPHTEMQWQQLAFLSLSFLSLSPSLSLSLFLVLLSVGVSACLFVYVQQSRVGTQKVQNHNAALRLFSSPLGSSRLLLLLIFSPLP